MTCPLRRARSRPTFSGDGVDGTEDPRELETDVDGYEPMPPLDSRRESNYLRKGRTV